MTGNWEKIQISTTILVTTQGSMVSYIHPGNQLGVLVEFDGDSINPEIGKDVAMQVASNETDCRYRSHRRLGSGKRT